MQAESFVETAQMIADETTDEFNPGVSASLAVLAGIAASDAACCARLGVRSRGEAHSDAVALLGTVLTAQTWRKICNGYSTEKMIRIMGSLSFLLPMPYG
jgi:hypothetical protein